MADILKILGQLNPSAATLTDLYTVPSGRSVASSSIVIANRSATPTTFRISVAPAGAADSDEQYLYYDISIPANDSFVATIGITLEATDVVRVRATLATLSFNLFGLETTTIGGGQLTVEEADADPSVSNVDKLVVGNGKLTDDGAGQVTLDLSGDVAAFNDLSDVTLTSPTTDHFLRHNGSVWINDVRQTAVNKITDVAGATNEHVLTKDTGSGNAIFKVLPTQVSAFDDLSDVTLTSVTTDDFLRFNGSAWVNDARQTALDKITDVAGATNEQILTKDTGSGNAIFKDAPASGLTGAEGQSFTNLIDNGDFSRWTQGTSAAPDAWTAAGGATIAQESGAGNVRFGKFSLKLTSDADGSDVQNIVLNIGTTENNIFRGRTVTFGCWIKTSVASIGKIVIGDDVGSSVSSDHTGSGNWEFITVTRTLNAAANFITVTLRNTGNTQIVFFDGAILVSGTQALSFASDHPIKTFVGSFATNASASGSVSITGIGFRPKTIIFFLGVNSSNLNEGGVGAVATNQNLGTLTQKNVGWNSNGASSHFTSFSSANISVLGAGSGGGISLTFSITSYDADGWTHNETVDSVNWIVGFLAIG